MPQIGAYNDGSSGDSSDLMKAVNSIPAYIERSTHFFAVCPTVRHHDLPNTTCDFGSWLGRGWCRLELFALLLARYNRLPAIIVKGGETAPFMIAAQAVFSNLPGHGAFTCCARDHNINGVEIPCDKQTQAHFRAFESSEIAAGRTLNLGC